MKFSPSTSLRWYRVVLPWAMLTSVAVSSQVPASGLRRRLDSNSTALAQGNGISSDATTVPDGEGPPSANSNTDSPLRLPTPLPPSPPMPRAEGERSHRVWVRYKGFVTRSACLESLQSKLVAATGVSAAEAKALLQVDHEGTSAKASPSTTTPGVAGHSLFRVHYDFFETQLNAMVMTVDDAMLRSLQGDSTVERVSKDVKRYPMVWNNYTDTSLEIAEGDDPADRKLQGEWLPYGIAMVQADQVWDLGFQGQGVSVCVLDSGIDVRAAWHPEFDADWAGFSTSAGDWYIDRVSHGTHTSGTIAARWNGQGVVGVAPEATVLSFKVFNDLGEFAYSSTVANAALSCQNAGARVVSMSLGGPEYSQEEDDTFKFLYEQGVVSVASAGNEGSTSYNYPASYLEVVSVGAVDSEKYLAGFSQTNDRLDLVAPGVDVLSTVPRSMGSYGLMNGTSMAAPHVSGVAALLLSKNSEASAADVVNALKTSAEDLGSDGYDTFYGYGLVNAMEAISYV